ncbi:MAG: hypothetical protein QM392_08765 [Bacillota bacterium]|nr:hypothetical protein [Bacillota bacterium]
MPYFVWFGILGLLLLAAAGVVMLLVKWKDMIHLRRYHAPLGKAAAVSLAVHALWANIVHLGRDHQLLGVVGLLAIAGVLFGYYSITRARNTGEKNWRHIHWQVELGALVVAAVHGISFLVRILNG